MSFNLDPGEETLSDKVIDIFHFAYSHIPDEVTRSDIIKDILLECNFIEDVIKNWKTYTKINFVINSLSVSDFE